jgi:hypothetical protein
MEHTSDMKRSEKRSEKVRRCTGTPTQANGVKNHRNARAIFSGVVVVRKSVAHWKTENTRAPTLKAKARLKRLTEMMAKSKKTNLQTQSCLGFLAPDRANATGSFFLIEAQTMNDK